MSRWDGRHTPLSERFWEKVDKRGPDECWQWCGAIGGDGYGHIWDGTYTPNGNRRPTGAHIVSLTIANPSGRGGNFALHRCNNKSCVNPAHLYWGTRRDNAFDAIRDGSMVPVRQRRGSENSAAKLTDEQVKEIRSMAGTVTQTKIADMFGISAGLISLIVNRKRWSHLD